jgi:hypothetical protein
MMSDHTEIQEELAAYVAAQLTGAAYDRVDAHLESCAECRILVACAEGISAALQPGDATDPHPDPLLLHPMSRNGSTAGDSSVARHLETCESCSLEASTWEDWTGWTGRAESNPTSVLPVRLSGRRATSGRPWWISPAFAGGAALGAAAAVLILVLIPGIVPGEARWSGAAQPLWLDEPYLDASAPPQVSLEGGQPYLPLSVRFTPPSHLGIDDELEFTLENKSGRSLWSHRLNAQEARERLASPGFVLLLVPADAVQAGDCLLRVTAVRESSREPLLELPFKVTP